MRFAHGMPRFMLLFVLIAMTAHGRSPDGTLSIIRTPNNGMPALVRSGDVFHMLLQEEAQHIELIGAAGTFPLNAEWAPVPGVMTTGKVKLTDSIPAGTYALRVTAGGREDVNHRSVYVFEEFPETYGIAHVTDTHIGSGRHPRSAHAIMKDVIQAVNASDAVLALITGDLTENGDKDQFRLFLDVLDTCAVPTFVVPGNHDRQANHYEAFFGPLTYAFSFGQDGFLGFDTKDFLVADDMGRQDGLLHRFRRILRPKRWTIGFTHRYEPTMGMRAQLTLFVDDPLDYLLYGHFHREAGERDGIPWGRTPIIVTPAAINGAWRLIEVDEQGVHPRPTEQSAEIR